MTYALSKRSLSRLQGVHPDLQAVIKLAIKRTGLDFTVLEGMRTVERQRGLVASGASTTMNSRHLTGHAVDIAPLAGGQVSWDWPLYYRLEPIVKQAANDLGVPLEWGGDWRSFKDGPHWQLPWSEYGKTDHVARHLDLSRDKAVPVAPPPPVPPVADYEWVPLDVPVPPSGFWAWLMSLFTRKE